MVEELKYAQIKLFGVESEPVEVVDEEDEDEDEDDEDSEDEDEDDEEEEDGWQN